VSDKTQGLSTCETVIGSQLAKGSCLFEHSQCIIVHSLARFFVNGVYTVVENCYVERPNQHD